VREKVTVDRRVARTRALLQEAHLRLVIEKGYDATSVEDICQAANVGRSTFYSHFADKDDLHRSGLENLRRQLLAHHAAMRTKGGDDGQAGLAFSLPMFEHARDHLDLYRALTGGRGGAIAMEAIRRILCDVVRAGLPADHVGGGPARREFAVQYLVGAYLAVLTAWLDAGAAEPAQAMDALFQGLARDGLGWLEGADRRSPGR